MNRVNSAWPKLGDLENTLDRDSLAKVLREVLETILHLPWLATNAGGVFLAHPGKKRLELLTQINFTPFIAGTCSQVKYGHCLCGRVAVSGRLLHVDCVDERHETRYEGMSDHGHYVVPIRWEGETIGVMVLYVAVHHAFDAGEAKVLEDFADLMALLIHTWHVRQDMALADMILIRSNHGILITDASLKIQWVNRAFERISGYRLHEILGQSPKVLASGRHGPEFYADMWRSIERDGYWEGEIWNRRKDGRIYPQWSNIIALKDRHGEVLRYAAMFIDLSPIREAEEKIHRLAYYDEVTGLPNRNWLRERLRLVLAGTRPDAPAVLLLVQLRHFQEVNATLGHDGGDALLKEAASRLKEVVPRGIVARMGTDEFAVAWCPGTAGDAADEVERVVGRIRERLSIPFRYADQELDLESHFGMTWGKGGDPRMVEELLQRATAALNACVRRGVDRVVYDEALGREVVRRHALATAITQAIEREELFLVYQPQVDRHGGFAGAEVLVRWENAVHGLVPPDEFIPLAEDKGFIVDLGLWVFETVVRQMKQWREQRVFPTRRFPRLAVNLSPLQLLSPKTVSGFTALCRQYGIDAADLELEITETAMARHSETALKRLAQLREQGFRIAIDDFGTGHSSLARLHQFPVDVLKIDRSFVANLARGERHATLLYAIIRMAHGLGFQVIVEGIEDESQYRRLREWGVDWFQGYYFGRPLSAEALVAWAEARCGLVSA